MRVITPVCKPTPSNSSTSRSVCCCISLRVTALLQRAHALVQLTEISQSNLQAEFLLMVLRRLSADDRIVRDVAPDLRVAGDAHARTNRNVTLESRLDHD